MRVQLLVFAVGLFAACSPSFDPASKVDKLRLLALRAEPPEIAPTADGTAPDRAQLTVLVAHPMFVADPARRATVIHLACTPTPGDPAATPCTALSSLAAPEQLLAGADLAGACAMPGMGKAGAITFAGVEACGAAGCEPVSILRDPADSGSVVSLPVPAYQLPPSFGFDALPAGAPERILGIEVVELALVLDASPAELSPVAANPDACAALGAFGERFLAAWPRREHLFGIKRIQVRGPAATDAPNLNPAVSGMTLAGAPLPGVAAPGASGDLSPVLPPDAAALHQLYARRDATGAIISEETESWMFSWFATGGDLEDLHTQETDPERWTAPDASVRVLVYAVVRDLRGGTAWTISEVMVGR